MYYSIVRKPDQNVVCNVVEGAKQNPVLPIGWHGSEFNFGYGGSGPAELALAILTDYFDENLNAATVYAKRSKAWDLHQDFKWAFLAGSVADKEDFTIEEKQISEFCMKTILIGGPE